MSSNDENAPPPNDDEIRELWRKNRANLMRADGFLRGRVWNVTFIRTAKKLSDHADAHLPVYDLIHRVAFHVTERRYLRLSEICVVGHEKVTATEIHGNDVLVERIIRKGWD